MYKIPKIDTFFIEVVVLMNSWRVHSFKLVYLWELRRHKIYWQVKFQAKQTCLWRDMEITKKCTNCAFCGDKLSVKFKYLKNATLFFQTTFVEIHQTVASIIYVRNEANHRSTNYRRNRSWVTRNRSNIVKEVFVRITIKKPIFWKLVPIGRRQ
jgi:hypothetical protein